MKRTKLIEYTLIVIAAIFGYKFFEGIFGIVVQFVAGFSYRGFDFGEILWPLALVSGAYLLLFILLIRKSREIAIYLNGNNVEETLPLKIGKKALLHLIILGICITTILSVLPDLLIYLYETLKTKKTERAYEDFAFSANQEKTIFKIIRLVVAVIVMATAKEITNWFLKNDDKDELILEAENSNP